MSRIDIDVECCSNCKNHRPSLSHSEEKYATALEEFKNACARAFPKANFHVNRIPEHLSKMDIWSYGVNAYLNVQSQKIINFPRIGAFEVKVNGNIVFSTIEFKAWPVTSVIIQHIKRLMQDEGVGLPQVYRASSRGGSEPKNILPEPKLSKLMGVSMVQDALNNTMTEGFNPNLMRGNPNYEILKNRSISLGKAGGDVVRGVLNSKTIDAGHDNPSVLQDGQQNMKKDYRSNNYTARTREKTPRDHKVLIDQNLISRPEYEIWNQHDPVRPNKLGTEVIDRKGVYNYKTIQDDLIGIPSNYERYRRRTEEKAQFQNSLKVQPEDNYSSINPQYAETNQQVVSQKLGESTNKKHREKAARENKAMIESNVNQSQLPKPISVSQRFTSPNKSEVQNRPNQVLAPMQQNPSAQFTSMRAEPQNQGVLPVNLVPSFGALPQSAHEVDQRDDHQNNHQSPSPRQPIQQVHKFESPPHAVETHNQYENDSRADSEEYSPPAKQIAASTPPKQNNNNIPIRPMYVQQKDTLEYLRPISYEVPPLTTTPINTQQPQTQNLNSMPSPKETRPPPQMKESVNILNNPKTVNRQPTPPRSTEKKGYVRPPSPQFNSKPVIDSPVHDVHSDKKKAIALYLGKLYDKSVHSVNIQLAASRINQPSPSPTPSSHSGDMKNSTHLHDIPGPMQESKISVPMKESKMSQNYAADVSQKTIPPMKSVVNQMSPLTPALRKSSLANSRFNPGGVVQERPQNNVQPSEQKEEVRVGRTTVPANFTARKSEVAQEINNPPPLEKPSEEKHAESKPENPPKQHIEEKSAIGRPPELNNPRKVSEKLTEKPGITRINTTKEENKQEGRAKTPGTPSTPGRPKVVLPPPKLVDYSEHKDKALTPVRVKPSPKASQKPNQQAIPNANPPLESKPTVGHLTFFQPEYPDPDLRPKEERTPPESSKSSEENSKDGEESEKEEEEKKVEKKKGKDEDEEDEDEEEKKDLGKASKPHDKYSDDESVVASSYESGEEREKPKKGKKKKGEDGEEDDEEDEEEDGKGKSKKKKGKDDDEDEEEEDKDGEEEKEEGGDEDKEGEEGQAKTKKKKGKKKRGDEEEMTEDEKKKKGCTIF